MAGFKPRGCNDIGDFMQVKEEYQRRDELLARLDENIQDIRQDTKDIKKTHSVMWEKINLHETKIALQDQESKNQKRDIILIGTAISGIVSFTFNYLKGMIMGK